MNNGCYDGNDGHCPCQNDVPWALVRPTSVPASYRHEEAHYDYYHVNGDCYHENVDAHVAHDVNADYASDGLHRCCQPFRYHAGGYGCDRVRLLACAVKFPTMFFSTRRGIKKYHLIFI